MEKLKELKPGSWVFCIGENDYCGYIFVACCLGYVITCPEYVGYEGDFVGQIKEMSLESYEFYESSLRIFPARDVFLTESEAIENLKERS